jgi:hypothetical protein
MTIAKHFIWHWIARFGVPECGGLIMGSGYIFDLIICDDKQQQI